MYLNLYKGLGLEAKNLTKYNTPLVGFDRKIVMLDGKITLPVVIERKEVMENFIVMNAFSLYTAILARPWIHVMGTMPSILHVKVKFPTELRIAGVKRD